MFTPTHLFFVDIRRTKQVQQLRSEKLEDGQQRQPESKRRSKELAHESEIDAEITATRRSGREKCNARRIESRNGAAPAAIQRQEADWLRKRVRACVS